MSKKTLILCLAVFVFVGAAWVARAEHVFDKNAYVQISKANIGRIISGNIDADAMLADMEKLVKIGVDGCKEHMGEAGTPKAEKDIMQLVIKNAAAMGNLSLDEIENQWHEGGTPKAAGLDIGSYDHFSEVMCHYDGVVHPATAIICLKKYKATHDSDLLDQMKDELAEVVEHMGHL